MAERNGGQSSERNEAQGHSGGTGTAIKAVAAAAATGAAAYAARKALTRDSSGGNGGSSSRSSKSDGGIVGSIFSGSWDAARDQLLPLAEDAAGMAGKFVAENGPDVVRDRIVPKFISSFEDAHGR